MQRSQRRPERQLLRRERVKLRLEPPERQPAGMDRSQEVQPVGCRIAAAQACAMDRTLLAQKCRCRLELARREKQVRHDAEPLLQHRVDRAGTRLAILAREPVGELSDQRRQFLPLFKADMALVGRDDAAPDMPNRSHQIAAGHLDMMAMTRNANGGRRCDSQMSGQRRSQMRQDIVHFPISVCGKFTRSRR